MTPSLAQLDALATRCLTPSGDGIMVWRIWGAGPPLLLLHGASGTWRHWVRNIAALSEYFTLFVPDMPGFGDSDDAPAGATADTLAEIVSAGLDVIVDPPEPLDIAGFSFGGIVGGLVAARQGRRARTLVLCGPNGLGLPGGPLPPLARVHPDMTLAEMRDVHRANLCALMLADPAHADELAVDVHMENVRTARFKSGDIPASDVLLRALPRISARLAGIWGSRDVFAGPYLEERRRALARFHPEVDFRVVEGAGHWAIFEAAPTVNAILLEVLGASTARL